MISPGVVVCGLFLVVEAIVVVLLVVIGTYTGFLVVIKTSVVVSVTGGFQKTGLVTRLVVVGLVVVVVLVVVLRVEGLALIVVVSGCSKM